MRITTYILIGLLIGVVSFILILKNETGKCREAMAVMKGVDACMDTPGCFYNADNLIEAKQSFDHYNKVCKKTPA